MPNQNPKQLARDHIDAALSQFGWTIQDKNKINLSAAHAVTVKEYQTDTEPSEYNLFVYKVPVGIIKDNRQEKCVNITCVNDLSEECNGVKLKYLT